MLSIEKNEIIVKIHGDNNFFGLAVEIPRATTTACFGHCKRGSVP